MRISGVFAITRIRSCAPDVKHICLSFMAQSISIIHIVYFAGAA